LGMLRYTYQLTASNEFKFLNDRRLLFRLKEESDIEERSVLKYPEVKIKLVGGCYESSGVQKKDSGEWSF